MRGRKSRVVFATYQSSPQIVEAQRLNAPRFDLVVADEAHRTAGVEAGPFRTVLTDIKAHKTLFQTATPRVFGSSDEGEVEVFSMDDPTTYGPVVHALSFRRAIKKKLLADYQLHISVASKAEALQMIQDRELLRLDENVSGTDARTLAIVMTLHQLLREERLRRAVTFHSRVDWAGKFARLLSVWDRVMAEEGDGLDLTADVISGRDGSLARSQKLNLLGEAANVVVLTNARCLTEGIDVPELDLVAFVDPKRSKIDLAQAIGRVLRTGRRRRKLGRVLVPLFIEPDADLDQAFTDSSYKGLRDVLLALREFDEALVEQLDGLRRSYGARDSSIRLPDKFVIDGPRQLSPDDAHRFEDSLAVRVVKLADPTQTRWWEKYNEVVEVGWRNVKWDTPLGKWLNDQRQRKKNRVLRAEYEQALDAIGFEWDPRTSKWLGLADEIDAVGVENIRYRSKLYADVVSIRARKKAGTLPDVVVARFEDIGFEWSRHASETEVFEQVRVILEKSPGLPIIRLADSVGWSYPQRMRELVRKWESDGRVKTARDHRSLRVYLPDDLRDPIRERQATIRNYVDHNPGCSWSQLCRDLGQARNKRARRLLLVPLVENGDVLAVTRPGGERLFPGDQFTREDALRFFYPRLFTYIRKHPGCSSTDLVREFGQGVRQTLRQLDAEGVLRHTEGRTRGAVTHHWHDAG
jgi:hypothetical protein